MKKILGLIILAGIAGTAFGQDAAFGPSASRWYLGITGKYLRVSDDISFRSLGQEYVHAIEAVDPSTSIKNDGGVAFDLQLGYFFDRKSQWGIATGFMFERYKGVLSMDKLRLQYQSVDFNGDVFRQVITAERPFSETLKTTMLSVPLVLKYRTQLSGRLGLMVDAGAVLNIRTQVKSTADASFRYEAIYKYTANGDDYKTVYDANLTPDASDWLITKAHYQESVGDGLEAQYFGDLRSEGYNVALAQEMHQKRTVFFKAGSIGAVLQPSLTYALSKGVGLQVGGFLRYQALGGGRDKYSRKITDQVGVYESYLNNAEGDRQFGYGAMAGVHVAW